MSGHDDDGGDTAFGFDGQIPPSRFVHGFNCCKKNNFSVVITRVDAWPLISAQFYQSLVFIFALKRSIDTWPPQMSLLRSSLDPRVQSILLPHHKHISLLPSTSRVHLLKLELRKKVGWKSVALLPGPRDCGRGKFLARSRKGLIGIPGFLVDRRQRAIWHARQQRLWYGNKVWSEGSIFSHQKTPLLVHRYLLPFISSRGSSPFSDILGVGVGLGVVLGFCVLLSFCCCCGIVGLNSRRAWVQQGISLL